jgi:EAL domain-containing protein (putative c-di-GMP-specific phosphodiesterase class I)
VQDDDWVSRQGGDEFTIVLARPTTVERIEAVANRLIEVLSERFTLGENQAFVSASIGITLYPNDADDVDGLFRNADQALYESKRSGRSCFSYFTPLLQESAQARMSMANDLRVALAEKQFYVAYQPIIELATGAIHKAEALVRWAHPVRGLISPADFIPIAESTGLIVEIGDWVFRQAAQQVKLWRQRYHPEFQISVNKSPVQFHQGHLIRQSWAEHLLELGLPGQALLVEITEGLLLDPRPEVIRHLRELRAHGIGASLDDFGTGYSSLSYLQKYDIDFVKIDQSFVRNLSQESKDLALCKAIVVMAHELGMKVIAEGVETELQFQMLLEAGCDYGQGYLFGRPVPADELDTLLAGPKRAAG